jgi:tetratricopeptide (TPR) repeat protein
LIHRGDVYQQNKEFDKAIADYNAAIEIDRDQIQAFIGRGVAHKRQKKYTLAIADYNEALKIDPENADANNAYAWLLATCPEQRIRDAKKALQLATKACELTQWKDAYYFDTLAAAYAKGTRIPR